MQLDKWVSRQPSLVRKMPSSISNKVSGDNQANAVNLSDLRFMRQYEYYRDHADQYPEEFAAYQSEILRRIGYLKAAGVLQ